MTDPNINLIDAETDHEGDWPELYTNPNFGPSSERTTAKKRADNLPSFKWITLAEILFPLKEYIQYVGENWKDRQPDVQQVENMRKRLAPRDSEICAIDNPKTTLCQFWKFIQTHEVGKLLTIGDAISKTRLRAFFDFCEHKKLLPATILSKINHLNKFLNWLKLKPGFQTKEKHIENCLQELRNCIHPLNTANEARVNRKNIQIYRGEAEDMLTGEEIVQLNNKCNKQLLIFINNINKHELARTKLKSQRKIAYDFQTCLQIICLLNIGTQRRQIVAGLTENEITAPNEDEQFGLIKLTRENMKRKTGSATQVPKNIVHLLNYFKAKVRHWFNPLPELSTLWVASRGGVVQQGPSMTKAIKKQIALFLPGKYVTPSILKRSVMLQHVVREKIEGDCQSLKDALERYAKIVNTNKEALLLQYTRHYEHLRKACCVASINQRLHENDETRDLQFTINAVLEISNRIKELKTQEQGQADLGQAKSTLAEKRRNNLPTSFDMPLTIAGVDLLESDANLNLVSGEDEANEGAELATFYSDETDDD